jgi:NTE family protein
MFSNNPNRPKIGLTLGGGVIRGFAHVGVVEVLEEENIPIDFVSGASVGSLIGYAVAAGMKAQHITEMAHGIGWLNFARPVWPMSGFVNFAGLEKWLVETFGDLHFSDLARPFVVVASDLESGEPFVIDHGPVAPAIRASCSVPGFVEPYRYMGRSLCDGGISNNLPTREVRQLGADYVIAVDIFKHAHNRRLGPLAAGLAAVEIMVQHSGSGMEHAECIIRPELENVTYLRFGKRPMLTEIGRRAARAALPEIRRELAAIEARLVAGATGLPASQPSRITLTP